MWWTFKQTDTYNLGWTFINYYNFGILFLVCGILVVIKFMWTVMQESCFV